MALVSPPDPNRPACAATPAAAPAIPGAAAPRAGVERGIDVEDLQQELGAQHGVHADARLEVFLQLVLALDDDQGPMPVVGQALGCAADRVDRALDLGVGLCQVEQGAGAPEAFEGAADL